MCLKYSASRGHTVWRIIFYAVALVLVVLGPGLASAAESSPLDFPPTGYCTEPDVRVSLRAEELEGKQAWSRCEAWVWSCIVQGKEANLFAKKCTGFRPDDDEQDYRRDYLYAPFVTPDDYTDKNALSDNFLRTILSEPYYRDHIPPAGVRIFGAYFGRAVNLENVTTTKNLVLDGSIFKRGIRMTNFETTKNVSLDRANVRGKFQLMRASIGGSLFLGDGVYDFVDARDARIGASLEASKSVFTDMFRFDRAHISGKVYLVKSRLTSLNAWDATIGGSMELRRADIRLRMDLTGSTIQGDMRLQEMSFGRQAEGRAPSCEWDPDPGVDHILHEVYRLAQDKSQPAAEKVLDELMRDRPTRAGKKGETLCDESLTKTSTKVADKRTRRHELLLRDMTINGTLCVMDTSGLIAPGTASGITNSKDTVTKPVSALDTISFDGTKASATVLRWTKSESPTLWHAVNFKTGHMLINLEAEPKRHFIDNLDVGFISLVKRARRDDQVKTIEVDEDDDKYLCDVTPRGDNMDPAEGREAQDRFISFFTGDANTSQSAQPFENVVSRLESTGLNTTHLKIALSEYRLRNQCKTSVFWKAYPQFLSSWKSRKELSWRSPLERIRDAKADMAGSGQMLSLNESRKLGLDSICAVGLSAYKWSVNYGHEPLNLFYFFFGFIGLFGMLLKLDKAPSLDPRFPTQHLGFIYALDTFMPLVKFRINQEKAAYLPHRPWLRTYLNFHRIVGAAVCLAIFIFVINATRN